MPSAIIVDYINDMVHERNACHSAHRAHKKGRPFGPITISDGVVQITITYADGGNAADAATAGGGK